ncbi:ATP-binding protein [Calditrichota bacterium GD2]
MRPLFKSATLRLKMMLAVGGVVVVFMVFISIGIALHWRSMILQQLQQKAEAVTSAFGISVLDALIYSENENFQVEDLLESYMLGLKEKIPEIQYIVVTDTHNRVIAHTDPRMYNRLLTDELSGRLAKTTELVSGIYRAPQFGWLIETALPLQVGGKRWGILRIAFEAESTQREIARLFYLLVGITLLLTLVVLSVLNYLIKHTVRSLMLLVQAMDSMELDSSAPLELPERADEIGALTRHFELLRQRLQNSQAQLLEAQKQIYHAEKLASIGRLASGVAHEINNPLNGIKHCVYAIEKEPQNQKQLKEYMALINEGLEHIESVVRKLLGFSRKSARDKEWVDLNQVVRQVVELLAYRLNQRQIDLQLQLAADLPPVYGDASLLQEVVMNLLLNGYDAVEDGGRVIVRTEVLPSQQVRLTIEDNGMGINETELEKIFEPFYTTKEPGKGTGLGLSVALNIVQAHGGQIVAHSQPAKGTRFEVILPHGERQ